MGTMVTMVSWNLHLNRKCESKLHEDITEVVKLIAPCHATPPALSAPGIEIQYDTIAKTLI
jgi:hypothetical protein